MKRLAFTALLCAAAALLVAQQPSNPATPQPTTATTGQPDNLTTLTTNQPGYYVGAATCVNSGCHGSTEPLSATRILQNEFYTWLNNDRHAGGYNVLFNERSARIVKNMRLRKRAYEEKACLDCHTTNVPAQQVAGQVDIEDGVQCEACHGPASGWRAQHAEDGWTHAQSVARGMLDLDHLPTRAHLCHRCHLGSQDKEVDHQLIASGHPVLAFELDNYAESMPAHWKRDEAAAGVRAWAVGQVMKFRDSLSNVARHARGDKWPEFSDMSCGNCHHSLRGSTWRQERGWPDRAGLPTWSPQHWAMLRLIIGRASPGARGDLDPLVAQLARGVSRMNDAAGVATTADRARQSVHNLVPRVESLSWSDTDVRALMRTVASERGFLEDVDAAQQAALALQSLNSALTRRNPALLRGATTRSIDALFDEIDDRDSYDPARFGEKLAAVKGTL